MNFNNYKDWAITTRADTYQPIASPVLSLVEEFDELTYAGNILNGMVEVGDIVWYIVNLAHDLDIKLVLPEKTIDFNVSHLLAQLCGLTKRSIRDQILPDKSVIENYLHTLLSLFCEWDMGVFECCLQLNYNKLTKRVADGTIKDINRG